MLICNKLHVDEVRHKRPIPIWRSAVHRTQYAPSESRPQSGSSRSVQRGRPFTRHQETERIVIPENTLVPRVDKIRANSDVINVMEPYLEAKIVRTVTSDTHTSKSFGRSVIVYSRLYDTITFGFAVYEVNIYPCAPFDLGGLQACETTL